MSSQFVQVGSTAINLNLVTEIWFRDDHITFYFPATHEGELSRVTLHGAEREAFVEWWMENASVHYIKEKE